MLRFHLFPETVLHADPPTRGTCHWFGAARQKHGQPDHFDRDFAKGVFASDIE